MHLGPALLLLLVPPDGSGDLPSAAEIVADARLAAIAVVSGPGRDAFGPIYEIELLEREVRRRWDEPGGPGESLALLALAHAAAAETRLELVLGRGEFDRLRRVHEYAHEIGASPEDASAVSVRAEPFLRGLRAHRPRLAASLERVPAVRRALLAAVAPPGRRLAFDPTEPMVTAASVCRLDGEDFMQLSSKAERGSRGGAGLSSLVYESFNWHTLPAWARLSARAAAGKVGRDDSLRAYAALEQLSFAHELRVVRDHFAELDAAGFVDDPAEWVDSRFTMFLVPPSVAYLRTAGYPYDHYGPSFDLRRYEYLVGLLGSPPPSTSATGPAACTTHRHVPGRADVWEALVLADRLRHYPGRRYRDLRERLRDSGAFLREAAVGDPLYYLHRSLPHEIRFRLSVWSGGEHLAAAFRGAAAALVW